MSNVVIKQLPPDPDAKLMGLENENLSSFPGVESQFEIPVMPNGEFKLGLDGKDKETKALKTEFENHFGVTFDSEEGEQFLSDYKIQIKHDITAYDPLNIKDKFDLHILKVNKGMGVVAFSDEDMESLAVNTYRFKATDEGVEVKDRIVTSQRKVAASTKLNELFKGDSKRLVTIAKYIFGVDSGIGNTDLAFDRLFSFIEAHSKNVQAFLDIVEKEPEFIHTVVLVRDAINRSILRKRDTGVYYHFATGADMGRTEDELVKYCLNPNNIDIVGRGFKDDLPTSIMAQLNKF